MSKEIIIFTDGSSRGNPGPGGWGSVIILGDENSSVFEIGGREDKTTNNRMELTAIRESLKFLKENNYDDKVIFYTDSSYAIQGVTSWISGWKRNDWITSTKTEVSNKDLWVDIDSLLENQIIEWRHVRGHIGVPGNERADEIATLFADKKESETTLAKSLPVGDHKVSLLDFSFDEESQKELKEKRERSKKKAHSYLSLVDGKVERHETWDDCSKRVKGKSGVKFRKSISEEDEKKILNDWNVSLNS